MAEGIPSGSISKTKAQLRQTTRLLAKEDLKPDLRVLSERRKEALETELAQAEQSTLVKKRKEQYKGLRFIERQKLLRKIKQAKAACAANEKDAAAKEELVTLRVDLYYVLKHPLAERYTALFPAGEYVPHNPSLLLQPSTSGTTSARAGRKGKKDPARSREARRAELRAKLESGELEEAPEDGDLGMEADAEDGFEAKKYIAKPPVAGEKKRKREPYSQQEEGGEGASAPVPKKAKVPAAAAAPVQPAAPNKKPNRKERRAAKREEEAAVEVPAPVSASAPAKKPKEVKKVKAAAAATAGKEESDKAGKKSKAKGLEDDDFFA